MRKIILVVERMFDVMAKLHWLNQLDRATVRWLKLSENMQSRELWSMLCFKPTMSVIQMTKYALETKFA